MQNEKEIRRAQQIMDRFQEKQAAEQVKSSISSVIVIDIKMPFWSMVRFMIKWALASIPAVIILVLIFVGTTSFIGGIIQGYKENITQRRQQPKSMENRIPGQDKSKLLSLETSHLKLDGDLQKQILIKLRDTYPSYCDLTCFRGFEDKIKLLDNLDYLFIEKLVSFDSYRSKEAENYGKLVNASGIRITPEGIDFITNLPPR